MRFWLSGPRISRWRYLNLVGFVFGSVLYYAMFAFFIVSMVINQPTLMTDNETTVCFIVATVAAIIFAYFSARPKRPLE
jgi:hypothetical protein